MKLPRLTRSTLLLIRFPAILIIFTVLMVVGSRTISSVTEGINNHLFKSARYEEATRAEMEFNDLLGKSYRFASGDATVRDVDVTMALDIFWSRMNVLETASYRRALSDADVVETGIVSELVAALPELERSVNNLRFAQPESFAKVGQFAILYHEGITHFSDTAYSARRKQMRIMVEKEVESLGNLKVLQLEFSGLASLTFLYVFFELYMSRRGNRKLAMAIEEKQQLLVSDHLTGIGNRRQLELALQKRGAEDELCLVMIDLDGFKGVNDTLGHAAGDHLLKHVASIMSTSCGMDDVVCRLGGDEFAVLLRGSKGRAGAFANRILQRLQEPVSFEGNVIRAAASIGIAHTSDTAGRTTACLLRNADAALYAAKAAGRHCVQFNTPEIASANNRQKRLQSDLKVAIAECWIDIAYQPIVLLDSGGTTGMEALVRWEHPEYGSISPCEIIQIAEQTNQILPLTLYVIDRACSTRNHLAVCGHDLQITANVSPGLMALAGFAHAVGDVMARHGLRQGELLLELTEDAMMAECEAVDNNIEFFRSLGIYLAVDDFGKGYSNLSRLASLEFRKIKLDKSLVDGVTTSGRSLDIVRGISRMASDLGINVVAEGVESAEQQLALQELGIRFAQGFYFARPMSALSLLAHLEQAAVAELITDDAKARKVG